MDYPKRKLIMLPGPTNVPDRVMDAMIKPMINHRGETFTTLLKEVTEKSKSLFQTTESPLILSASGTGGVEAAVWNLVRPGDKVVVPVYGEFGSRLSEAVELAGGEAIRVTSEFGTVPSLEAVTEAVRRTANLKAVYLVHNETSTGCTVPYVEELGRVAAREGGVLRGRCDLQPRRLRHTRGQVGCRRLRHRKPEVPGGASRSLSSIHEQEGGRLRKEGPPEGEVLRPGEAAGLPGPRRDARSPRRSRSTTRSTSRSTCSSRRASRRGSRGTSRLAGTVLLGA